MSTEKDKAPKISVIVPVYNVEKYLHRCIESILAQTFTDFELLLIDDGSTDKSGNICDGYAQKDKRIMVFHKKNGGVSSARNLGIDNATGIWLYFVDSDDLIDKDAFNIFMDKVIPNIDLIMAGYYVVAGDGTIVERPKNKRETNLTYQEALKEMFKPSDLGYQGYLWCKIFKNQIIKDNLLYFDENISFNEDRLFIINYICASKKNVVYTTVPVYSYISRIGSAMSSLKKAYNKKFATDFDAYILMYDKIIACTQDCELKRLVIEGICNSYKMNHKMMLEFNQYDVKIHKFMFKKLFHTGAIFYYLISIAKPFIGYLGLLLFPKLLIKISNK